jgi:hypothetical protein
MIGWMNDLMAKELTVGGRLMRIPSTACSNSPWCASTAKDKYHGEALTGEFRVVLVSV